MLGYRYHARNMNYMKTYIVANVHINCFNYVCVKFCFEENLNDVKRMEELAPNEVAR